MRTAREKYNSGVPGQKKRGYRARKKHGITVADIGPLFVFGKKDAVDQNGIIIIMDGSGAGERGR